MERLTLLKTRSDVDAHVPEFRYLLERTVASAERVYPSVELRVDDEIVTAGPITAGDVLLLGESNVLLTEASLQEMRNALRAGHEIAVPVPLQSFASLLARHPIYTLHGYERLEAQALEAQARDSPDPADGGSPPLPLSQLPVSLCSFPAFRALCVVGVEQLLHQPAALNSRTPPVDAVRRGVFHQFIDYYGETRSDVLEHVPAAARSVLEIGCGDGGTAALLERQLGCQVTGVELNPVVAQQASGRMHRVLCGDIEELEIEGPFDLVLALEVIEHLRAPEGFLRRARDWARPGGRIVLSTPNVGHYAVVEDLLSGRWDYAPTGAMCYTHLRFFTRSTLQDLLQRCGFRDFEIHGQKTELPERFAACKDSEIELDSDSLATLAFFVVIDL